MRYKQLLFNFHVYKRKCNNCGSTVYHASAKAAYKAKKQSKYCTNCWDLLNGKPFTREFINLNKVNINVKWKVIDNMWKKVAV